MNKPNFRETVADEMIRHIEAGTAPWQKPWTPGVVRSAPFNPTSDKNYRGINTWWLEMQGHTDPRWMTYRQALAQGAQVRKGEKGTSVEYWKWTDSKPVLDGDGKPVLGDDGKPKTVEARLDRPKVFYATVFNAEQIDGLEPYVAPEPSWTPIDKAEEVLLNGYVSVLHDQADRAFYHPVEDRIHMPAKAAFEEGYEYYATGLHELGHATGHRNRLAREFGPFGSATYAKEELRAEMASFMVATEIGLGHYPERHAGYVESWLKAVKEDRNVLFQAARDAETVRTWIMEPDKRQALEQAAQQTREASRQEEKTMSEKEQAPEKAPEKAPEAAKEKEARAYLAVPFAEKDQAKAAGAKWDRKAKAWYAPDGTEPEAFAKWRDAPAPVPERPVSPGEEFADACRKHGLLCKGLPVMDGRWHRVMVDSDAKGQMSGSYRGFLDGRPSGQIMNYRLGDKAVKWVATGNKLEPEELDRLKAEAAQRNAQLREETRAKQREVAKRAFGIFENAKPAPADHPYLAAKQVPAHELRIDDKGNLLVPLRDAKGFLMNVQSIHEDGTKRFLKEGRKQGLMHVIKGADTGPIIVAEGYATAASLHAATGRTVAVAFDAGNLEAVGQALKKTEPERPLVFAADDDHTPKPGTDPAKHRNAGMLAARAAALATGGTVIEPDLTVDEKAKGMTDFNDIARSRGPKALADVLGKAIAPEKPKEKVRAPKVREMGPSL